MSSAALIDATPAHPAGWVASPYTLDELASIIKSLRDRGFRGVIIGSTVVDLELRRRRFEDDVDFFAIEPSPLVEEDWYRGLATEQGWEFTYTELGTPRLTVKGKEGDIVLEFYENIHDFYVPQGMLERAPVKRIKGVEVPVLRVEDYIVLKAKAGREEDMEDLSYIHEMIRMGKLKVDERVLRQAIEWIPEDERGLVVKRLRSIGFKV